MNRKERLDRLIGRTIVVTWEALGRADSAIERIADTLTRIVIPFVAGLFAGYAWAFYHAGGFR